jgi:hypothetical protein
MYMPKAVEAGICGAEEVWEEPQVFVCARKNKERKDAVVTYEQSVGAEVLPMVS